ncbi:MAG: restriction endonuclease subunit S [Prevotella sp.]|nr:restriction endonuclease subunit S [Prevotella sp.]
MKEGWQYKKIKDIATVIGGTTPNTNVAEYWDGNLCWISPAELDGSHYLYDSRKKITEAAVKAKSLKLLPEGTVILSSRAPIGKVVINKVPTYCNQGFKCVVCGKEIYNEFLYWWFWGKTEYLNSLGTGATFKEISKKVVEEITIPVPPLSEQQSIVDYLDSAFAKIDAMKANAEKALNEAKALFQASLKEMLEPKEGWEEKKVGEIAEIKGGKRLPKGEKLLTEPTKYKYIRVADFNEYGTVDLDEIQYISEKVYEQIKRYIINKEDIYISIAGTIGKSGIIPEELDGANLTENACRLILSKEINQKFMYYLTISPGFIRQEVESTKISAQPKLALTRLADILISYPSFEEQQKIADTLDSLKSKVDRLQENYDKISQECDALKQAILRKVFR